MVLLGLAKRGIRSGTKQKQSKGSKCLKFQDKQERLRQIEQEVEQVGVRLQFTKQFMGSWKGRQVDQQPWSGPLVMPTINVK